jgi:hypothetical protein
MLDTRLSGLDDIAAELRTSRVQVLRLASTRRPSRPLERRYRDPLRLQWLHGRPIIMRSVTTSWRRRNLQNGEGERKLWGWKAIYDRAELSKRAAEGAAEWEVDPLPVVRAQDGRVWAYESAIDEWRRARVFSRDVHRMLREARQLARHAGPSDRPRRRARWVGGAEGRRRAAPPERAEGVSA